MKIVETYDVFEASYYLSFGNCTIDRVEVTNENTKKVCKLILTGENLPVLQKKYHHGEATANVFDFRRSYLHVMNLLNHSKREAKRQEREEQSQHHDKVLDKLASEQTEEVPHV